MSDLILTMDLENGSKKILFADNEEMYACLTSGWINSLFDYKPIDIIVDEEDLSCIANINIVVLEEQRAFGAMF